MVTSRPACASNPLSSAAKPGSEDADRAGVHIVTLVPPLAAGPALMTALATGWPLAAGFPLAAAALAAGFVLAAALAATLDAALAGTLAAGAADPPHPARPNANAIPKA